MMTKIVVICLLNIFYLSQVSGDDPPEEEQPEVFGPGYYTGRLSEAQYEYPRLNGRMTPRKAERICDKDPLCGAFTFKGPLLLDEVFDIYFYYLAININQDLEHLKWTFFKTKKAFIKFNGGFDGKPHDNKTHWSFVRDLDERKIGDADEECRRMGTDCVAILRVKNVPMAAIVDFIHLDNFKKSDHKVTYVRTDIDSSYNVHMSTSYDNIDRCCPTQPKVDKEAVLGSVVDRIPRVACHLPKQTFLEKYVLPRKAVILVNCTHAWNSQRYWSVESLLKENEEVHWSADIYLAVQRMNRKYRKKKFLSGKDLSDVIKNNGTIRIFDKFSKRVHQRFRNEEGGKKAKTDKLHLMKDYSVPPPIPDDYVQRSHLVSNYQWIIVSHVDTGTGLHTDPEYTSPWNAVLTGTKWWVMLPNDVDFERLECDPTCSHKADNLSEMGWFTHILPQLRNRKVLGHNMVEELIHKPGEVIYMPGSMAHAVMNIEDNISVTENYFLPDSLDDYVLGVMSGEYALDGPDEEDGPSYDEEIIWKNLYYRLLNKKERLRVREMVEKVERMIEEDPEICDQLKQDDDEEEEEEEEEDDEEDDEGDDDDEKEEEEVEEEEEEEYLY